MIPYHARLISAPATDQVGVNAFQASSSAKFRNCSACAVVLALTAALVACDSSPTSPTARGGQPPLGSAGALGSTAVDPGLSQDAVTLKATTPDLMSPADGAVVNDPAVVLTAMSPRAVYDVPWVFSVRFEVYENSNPGQPIHTVVIPQGQGTTTYTVPTGVLQDSTLYVWRARAESDGAEGPWSSIFAFTTAFLNIDPPLPLVPTGGVVTASLRPRMTVANGAVTGDAGTVLVELHVGLDAAFTNPQVLRTHTRDRCETDLFFQSDLLPDMQYFWRARSTNQNLPETSALPLEGVLEVTTDWSATATFRTPTAEDASTATPAPTAGGTGSCCPPTEPPRGGPAGGCPDGLSRIWNKRDRFHGGGGQSSRSRRW